MKKIIKPKDLSEPKGPYSHGVKAKQFVFVAGQISRDSNGNVVGLGDMQTQTDQVLKNIKSVLRSEGLSLGHVVKITIYTTNMEEYIKFGRDIVSRYFEKDLPASVLIEVNGLAHKDYLVEIEAIAVIP